MVKTREEADRLRGRIKNKEDFMKTASKYSNDINTRELGGLIESPVYAGGPVKGLGRIPEFVDAAFQMDEGELSQPVKTDRGYHLIMVEARHPEGMRPLDDVRPDIVSRLTYNKRVDVTGRTLDELKSKYNVEYVSEAAEVARGPEELFKTASEASSPREKIKYYRQFTEEFPDNERVYEAEFMIGFTLAEDLKDYDEAERVFNEFLEKYPQGDLSDDARWMIENMRSGKEPQFDDE
jgi:hypothetical protein